MKNFDDWNELKKNIDKKQTGPLFHEREIWWVSLGKNIGFEQDGKNDNFERPVLVLKKFNKDVFLGLPFTTTIKDNKYYFKYDLNNKEDGALILSQGRLLSSKRLDRRLLKMPKSSFFKVVESYMNIVKVESPAFAGLSRVPSGNLYLNNSKNDYNKSSVKLSVQYYSQYLEVKDSEWNIRSCSGSCVAMAVEFLTGEKIDILEYMQTAEREGGYDKINGASHDYIISYFEKAGLKSWRYKNQRDIATKDVNNDIAPLIESLEKGNPVIVSINKIILEQKKFHLILLVGFEKNEAGEITHFYYHEPEATVASVENNEAVGGAFRKCDIETFQQHYRGRAIFMSK